MQQRTLLSAGNHMAAGRPRLLPANDEGKENHLPREKRKSRKGPNCQDTPLTHRYSGKAPGMCQEKTKIRRPPNSFFIFANEKRKEIAAQNPTERNKQISTRLGNLWKSLRKEDKERYVEMARKMDAEHKKKYPDYVYCPKEVRIQKALRAEARELKLLNSRSRKKKAAHSGASSHQQSDIKAFLENFNPQACSINQTDMPSGLLINQERSLQETTKGFPGQVGQNVYQRCVNPYQQPVSQMNAPQNWDCVVSSELNGQQWLSYIQVPQSNLLYTTGPNDEIKIQECDPMAHHMAAVHQQQVPCHPVTPQQVSGSSYRNCMQTQPVATAPDNSKPTAATGQIITLSARHVGGSVDDAASSVQQQLCLYQQQKLPQTMVTTDEQDLTGDSVLSQTMVNTDEWGLAYNSVFPHQLLEDDPVLPQMITTEDVIREEEIQMLDTIPISLENSMNLPPLDLLETSALIRDCLLQSDADSEMLSFEAILELDKFWN
jgi:hypothetical protein